MKRLLSVPVALVAMYALVWIFSACQKDEPEAVCKNTYENVDALLSEAQGKWALVSSQSGWTNQTTLIEDNIRIQLAQDQSMIVFKNDSTVQTLQFTITKTNGVFEYAQKKQSDDRRVLFLSNGEISLCGNNQLRLDNRMVDGPLYVFKKVD